MGNGIVDVNQPQIVLYEAQPDGSLKLTGADYLVIASAWDEKHPGTPQLMGQIFQYFGSPNRFGLPVFYTLHVWASKANPKGTFVNWHPTFPASHSWAKLPLSRGDSRTMSGSLSIPLRIEGAAGAQQPRKRISTGTSAIESESQKESRFLGKHYRDQHQE